jgi:hypothetical protein
LPQGAQTTARDDGQPRFRADVSKPAGALSDRRESGLAADATNAALAAAGLGPDQALRVWVLVHEQAGGSPGAGGHIIRYADLVALAGSPPPWREARGGRMSSLHTPTS